MTIRRLRIEDVAAFSAMAMIAFHIYWQYWFVDLMGVWVVNPLLPIAILGFVALVFIWRDHRYPDLRVALPATWAFLALYLLWSTASILVHETNRGQAIQWLVYAWSPAVIFLSIHGLKNFRDTTRVNLCVRFLFLVMVLLSIYSFFALNSHPPDRIEKPVLKWGDYEVVFDTRPNLALSVSTGRYTIPGLNSNHYGPMLLPLIFLGLYWAYQTVRTARYLFLGATGFLAYCLFGTQTRAAIIPLILEAHPETPDSGWERMRGNRN